MNSKTKPNVLDALEKGASPFPTNQSLAIEGQNNPIGLLDGITDSSTGAKPNLDEIPLICRNEAFAKNEADGTNKRRKASVAKHARESSESFTTKEMALRMGTFPSNITAAVKDLRESGVLIIVEFFEDPETNRENTRYAHHAYAELYAEKIQTTVVVLAAREKEKRAS